MCYFTSFNLYLTFFPLSSLTTFDLPSQPPSSASIDWLIQVKHGNGGEGKGLEELAKALKKLIGDAIEKAETSLEKRKKELECHKDFEHCKVLKEKIKEAKSDEKSMLQSEYNSHYSEVHGSESKRQSGEKDLAERRISLGNLAGQLSGFVGGGEEVKNAILKGLHSNVNQLEKLLQASCGDKGCDGHRSQIDGLKKELDKLKNNLKEEHNTPVNLAKILTDCNLYPSDGPLKQLNVSIPQKIQKLNNKIENLKNDVNQSKNASEIDKLNKDLQSHNASMRSLKTLSELCDFAGKINENHDNTKKLLDNLCTGLEKFLGYSSGNYTGEGIVYSDLDRLCDGVMAFLHGVLESVKEDENVTTYDKNNDIKNLPTKIGEFMHNGSNDFQDAITQVSEALRAWSGELEERTTKLTGTLESLSTNIDSNISSVGELHDFDVAAKQWRTAVVGALEGTLRDARLAIEKLDNPLQAKLKTDFENIKVRIHDFADNAKRDQEELVKLKSTVETELGKLRDEIIKEAREKCQHCIALLTTAFRSNIQDPIMQVIRGFYTVRDDLEKWSKKAKEVVERALQRCTEIIEKLNGSGAGSKGERKTVEDAVTALHDNADKLMTAVEFAKVKLGLEAEATQTALKTLDTAIKMDLNCVKNAINLGIKEYVEKLGKAFSEGAGAATMSPLDTSRKPGVEAFKSMLKNGALYTVLDTSKAASAPSPAYGLEWALHGMSTHLNHYLRNGSDVVSKIVDDFMKPVDGQLPKIDNSQLVNIDNVPTFSHYHGGKGDGGKKRALHDAIDQIKIEVNKRLESPEVKNITNDKLDEALKLVNENLTKFTKAVKDVIDDRGWARGSSSPAPDRGVKNLLQDLQKMVDDSGSGNTYGIAKRLDEIKTAIGIILNKKDAPDPKNTLEEIFRQADKFHDSTIPGAVNGCVSGIISSLQKKVAEKIGNIKYEAFKRYVASAQQQLREVRKDIDDRSSTIKNTIEDDKRKD
ncbi:hypothetical protein, conserved [Babesia ovata]|uniref:Extracellular matrix-binding ebh n=1 Tax=Babesia ovata TaxID=189622 RepID=A0A2H6KK11_9APIC|nr:uncharacterized protein BOVATA_048130 [Babesia ovata]GBE63320.1 hypothetical protein, conserved [Babesia ovata]